MKIIIIIVCILLQFVIHVDASSSSTSVKMRINNHAGAPIELYWVNVFVPTQDEVLQTEKPIRNASHTIINSYHTHQFVIKFARGHKMTLQHLTGAFMKGERDETIDVYFDEVVNGFKIHQSNSLDDLIDKLDIASQACGDKQGYPFASCVGEQVFLEVDKIKQSHETMTLYRDKISDRLRNYTCADESLNTSTPVETFTYIHEGHSYQIDALLDLPRAKIWFAHDFITEEECQKFVEHSKGNLRRATVAAPDGTSVESEHRRANQAHHSLPDENPEQDFLWPLYRRATNFANVHGGHDVQPEGQEGFTIIQYNPSDEYVPHCDGDCEGGEHFPGGRVATAVLYCTIPTKGGATTFTNADIFVKPKKYSAAIFSYKGADGLMDDGYTEHSGCPVLEGEKWVTTIWMREGVSKERNWEKIDPSGLDILTETDEEDDETNGNDELRRK